MFFPRKSGIFEKLVQQSSVVEEAARVFRDITHDWERLKSGSALLERLERKGDELAQSITDETEKTFILPLDKEDLEKLTESLDDVLDYLEEAVNRLNIYKILEPNDSLRNFSELIVEAAEQIHQGIIMMKERKIASQEFASCYKTVRGIEHRGDKLHRKVLEDLMGKRIFSFSGDDWLSVLKWKEIYQELENTLDKCDEIAVLFRTLRIKYR